MYAPTTHQDRGRPSPRTTHKPVFPQVIQISSAMSVHFDLKYNQLDYRLNVLTLPTVPADEMRDLCQQVLAARPCQLSFFTRQFRRSFGDADAMTSPLGVATLEMQCKGKVFNTIASERGHATERRDFKAAQGAGKAFLHHARRNVLATALNKHHAHGGAHPVAPHTTPSSATALAPDPLVNFLPAPFLQKLRGPTDAMKSLTDVVGVGAALCDLGAGQPAAPNQGGEVEAHGTRPPMSSSSKVARSGVGGSVYVTIYLSKMAAYKMAVGSRTLAKAEVDQVVQDAKTERREAAAEGGPRWQRWLDLFRHQSAGRQHEQRRSLDQAGETEYKQSWGFLGNPSLPVQPALVMDYVSKKGTPKDAEVYHSKEYIIFPEEVVHPLRGVTGLLHIW